MEVAEQQRHGNGSPHVAWLMPQTALILTHKGGPYEQSVNRRTNGAGELVEYLAADCL